MSAEPRPDITGKQFGVRLRPRGELFGTDDQHVMVQLMGEDDGNWYPIGNGLSSYWLDDLIDVLQRAKKEMKATCRKDKWGFTFRSEE